MSRGAAARWVVPPLSTYDATQPSPQPTLQPGLPPWASTPDVERVDFVNTALAQAWPRVVEAVASDARAKVNDIIAASIPPWLGGVRVSKCVGGGVVELG